MSWQAVKALVERSEAKRNPSCFLVLVVLAEHANPQGVAWPGIPLLAEKTGMRPRNVLRMLHDARELGELHSRRRGPAGGTLFHLTPGTVPVGPCDARCQPPEVANPPPEAAREDAFSATDSEAEKVLPRASIAAEKVQSGARENVTSSGGEGAFARAEPLVQPPEPPEPPSKPPQPPVQVVEVTGETSAEKVQWDDTEDVLAQVATWRQGTEPEPELPAADYEVLTVRQAAGPATNGAATTHVACEDYEAHRSYQRRTDVGWVCDACATGVPA